VSSLHRHLEVLPVILRFAQDDRQNLSQVRSREVFSPNVYFLQMKFDYLLPQSFKQIVLYPASTIYQAESPVVRLRVPQVILVLF
jgi:hypothetical protein